MITTRSMKIMRRLASLAAPCVAITASHPCGNMFASAASFTWKSSWKRCSAACSTMVCADAACGVSNRLAATSAPANAVLCVTVSSPLENSERVEIARRAAFESSVLDRHEEFPAFAGRGFLRCILEVAVVDKRHAHDRNRQQMNRSIRGLAGTADDPGRLHVVD